MKIRQFQYLFLFIFFLSSCTEEFDLQIENVNPRLVVEGLITDMPGPYYVRITKSNPGLNVHEENSKSISVQNAFVVISDDIGNIDTLIPAPVQYCYDRIHDNLGNVIDSVAVECDIQTNYTEGYYKTTHIQGRPNRVYYLKIILEDGDIYTAESFMPELPRIDSLSYLIRISEKDKTKQLVPLLYFEEPQNIKNYYMFRLGIPDNVPVKSAYKMWDFSIVSDELLEKYVSGLNIEAGNSPNGHEFYFYPQLDSLGKHNTIVNLSMSSLNEDSYFYYKSLIEQFNNDGGAYNPAPATPCGNITGNALGFFRASSVKGISKSFKTDLYGINKENK